MKKQYALIGLLTIVLGSTINVSAAQTTTNFSNNKMKRLKIRQKRKVLIKIAFPMLKQILKKKRIK